MKFVFLLVMIVGLFAFSACRKDDDGSQTTPETENENTDGEEEDAEEDENEEDADEEEDSEEDKMASTAEDSGACDTNPPANTRGLRQLRQRYFDVYYSRLEDVSPSNTESTVCNGVTWLLKEYSPWDRSSEENRRPLCDLCKDGVMDWYATNRPAECQNRYRRLTRTCRETQGGAAPSPQVQQVEDPAVQNADSENEDGGEGTEDEN